NVPSKLKNASIFAFPSEYEGFSLALAEAFAMGLPAVGCKDCPSVNSLIKNESNGLLTDPTPEAFAEGLAKLMGSEELRRKYGAQGREDIADLHDFVHGPPSCCARGRIFHISGRFFDRILFPSGLHWQYLAKRSEPGIANEGHCGHRGGRRRAAARCRIKYAG
ncbi:MAG: glycosyltransferase, partial [Mesosutterella sp.]|nr:glycosyltransferase [Mesosutterella sp.]